MMPVLVHHLYIEGDLLLIGFIGEDSGVVVHEGGKIEIVALEDLTIYRGNSDYPVFYRFHSAKSDE